MERRRYLLLQLALVCKEEEKAQQEAPFIPLLALFTPCGAFLLLIKVEEEMGALISWGWWKRMNK